MATRWNSKHTGQKIDDTIDYVTNPNLLDNWYFGNPVNQRGLTEYSGAGYCIDRWFAGDNKVTLEDDGILVTCNVAMSIFRQYLEFAKLLSGKVITFSVDAEIISGRWFLTNMSHFSAAHNDQPINNGITSYSFRVSDPSAQGSGPAVGMFSPSKGSQIKVRSIKLELGTQQTLAHQDADGNWVLNEIPDYGEQLRRCQRYFWRCKFARNDLFFGSLSTNLDRAWITIPTPVVMRTAPSVSFSETFNGTIRGNGFNVEFFKSNSAIGADTSTTRCFNILITPNTKPSAWTAQQVVMIYTSSEWYMDCSADL